MTRDEAKLKAWADLQAPTPPERVSVPYPQWAGGFDAGWSAAVTMLADRSGDLWQVAADAWAKRFVDEDAVESIDRSVREWGAE